MLDKAALWLSTLGLIAATSAGGSERINLHYNERAPYLLTLDNGGVTGLTATPAEQALRRAGIAFQWKKTPSLRQVEILQRNSGADCMVGWFKTPQRELIGNFSLPLYQDKPTIGLAHYSNTDLDSGKSLEEVLLDRRLVLLVKDGYSYGDFIDELIRRLNPRQIRTTVENINMLRMVALDRADYFFITEEEASELIRQSEFKAGDFKYVRFTNSPPGNQRHLWCSKRVSAQTMTRINRAIAELASEDR